MMMNRSKYPKSCPECGSDLKDRVVKPGSYHRFKVVKEECIYCSFTRRKENSWDKGIADGDLDEEIGILKPNIE